MTQEIDLAGQIMEYLQGHPDAEDTLEGITRWWLMARRVDHSVAEVRKALEKLKAEGRVVQREIGGGPSLYHARRP
jgi:Fe2+ or Zn2+ uptake regulation protein